MTNDKLSIFGFLNFKITDQNGNIKQDVTVPNLIVDSGKVLLCNRLKDDTQVAPSHIAVGTDATPASAGQTTLVAETGRVGITSATVGTSNIVYVALFPAGTATGTIVEAGIFNDATTGAMLSRTASLFVIKGASDTLTITWTVGAA